MIKVLHIISDLNIAGAQTVVMNYLRYFCEEPDVKMAVTVQTSSIDSSYERECERLGIEIHHLNYQAKKGVPGIRTIVNWIHLQRLHFKDIKQSAPTIIHTHVTPILRYTLFPILLSGVKTRFHTLHSDPYAIDKLSGCFAKLAFHLFNFHPICVTNSQAQKAVKHYGIKQFSLIQNGIDSRRFVFNDQNEIRRELGIEKDVFVIGCVGRFAKIKNHPFLLKLFSRYIEYNSHSLLLLVGDGEEKNHLMVLSKELGIEKNVLFTGIRADVERLYYAMNVFMLTSFYESSSIVTVEAQYAGVHCVVSDSIPVNVVATDLVNRIPLSAPIEKWLDAICGRVNTDIPVSTLDDFSMNKSAKELKKLYFKYVKDEKGF